MFKEKLQALINTGNSKKNIENAVVFIIILVVTIIIINTVWGEEKTDENNLAKENNVKLATNIETEEEISKNDDVEKKIKQILEKINGVGKVDVLITYSESSQIVAMYNETYNENQTEEEDTNGGMRTIKELSKDKEIIYKEENGKRVPITEKVVMPKMEGALVVAEGASNAQVKTNIIQAIEALTGIASHKIQVLEMKDNV